MLCYFDNDLVNLSHIEEIRSVRPLDKLKHKLSNSNFRFVHSTVYEESGLYVIEVSKHAPHWCGKSPVPSSINILQEIPDHVIKAVKARLLRIVIISIIEGDNYVGKNYNGFLSLHADVINLDLPVNSVLIISGNLNVDKQYAYWCATHKFTPIIEFIGGIEWDGKDANWQIPDEPIIYTTLKNSSAKSFNSLNRSHRDHRTDHLYYLAVNNLLDDALVSGGIWFTETNIKSEYKEVLLSYYPKIIDLGIDELKTPKEIHPSLTSNFSIYINSFLTIATESHYDQDGGIFITEKTFRPIALGHPFMILGQPLLLAKLYSMGFRSSFFDEYDSIINNSERFERFHSHLLEWKKMPYENKTAIIGQYIDNIQHNFNLYQTINFKKIMFDQVIESSKKYF